MALLFIPIVALLFYGEAAIAPVRCTVTAQATKLPVQSFQLSTEDGGTVEGWSIKAKHHLATVVLLHPIRGSRLTMLSRAELLHRHGYSVVMIDLQAHGESSGDVISLGHREKHGAAAAVNYARSLSDGRPVIVLGYSLGGASFLLSGETEVDGVILESVYPTISEAIFDRACSRVGSIAALPIAATLLWQMEWRLNLSRSELRPIDTLPQLHCPVMIMSGSEDQHTTEQETRQMFSRLPASERSGVGNQLWIVDNAAHVDLYQFCGREYESRILSFLNSVVTGAASAIQEPALAR